MSNRRTVTDLLLESWYGKSPLATLLRPLSWIYRLLIVLRRGMYVLGLRRVTRLRVPVIVVGNITVGGTGKTPFVIWLAGLLVREGWRPGIIARGYRGQARHWPQQVRPDADPAIVGDEPVLLSRRCACPVAVGPDRVAAAEALLHYHGCDIVISDDGLQHYALGRDIEVVMVDGVRRFGNGYCLPAGPLREPPGRLARVDFTVVTGGAALRHEYPMTLQASAVRNVRRDSLAYAPDKFPYRQFHAVAGIGHPARFFRQLKQLDFGFTEHAFPDHHEFTAADLAFGDDLPVMMTEKDAVKCRRFCHDNCWYLAVDARLDERLEARLLAMVRGLRGTAAEEAAERRG
ncbi:MAG: tetraacyldisaccharide 4'-kinase [Gammaproteobacteria bacterium]|nr:tetraacyldisaccharide 4'-kinase [Gammaproteobacteria bacterium]